MKNSSLRLSELNEFSTSYNNTDFKLILNNVSKRTEGLVMNDYIYFVKKKKSGTYGRVYVMTNSFLNKSIVLKKFESNEDYLKEKMISIIISNIQKDNNCKLNIVPSYWYEKDICNYIVMHYRDGSLHDLIVSDKFFNPFDIFLQVVESVYELYKYGIYYCDIKVANILYKTIDKKIKISLGDLGGIVFSNTNILHNLFSSKDLEGVTFKINNPNTTDNCNFNYYMKNKYFKIARTKLFNESLYDKNINVEEILDNNAVVKVDGVKLNLDSLYLETDECVFTFPHYNNSSGLIKFKMSDSIAYKRHILMNNIFQGLGIVFVQLLFTSYYCMSNELIEEYFEDSVNTISNNIDKSQYDIIERLLINEIILGNSYFNGLIRKNYCDYHCDYNVRSKFELLIKKIKILLS